jgi:hypothetical protein
MKMELLVDPILGLLKQSSTFAEDCRLKFKPNGLGFFLFLDLLVKLLNALRDTKNAMPSMPN